MCARRETGPTHLPMAPIVDSELVASAAREFGVEAVRWGCVVSTDPLTVRLEHSRRGALERLEAIRPWRTSTWLRSEEPVTEPCASPPTSTAPYEVAILSVPRPVDYVGRLLGRLRPNFPGVPIHIVTNQTSPRFGAWDVTVHVVTGLSPQLKARSIAMYEYALSVSARDVLVLEDDVLLRPEAGAHVAGAVAEIRRVRRVHEFVLDCYVVSWQGRRPGTPLARTFVETDYGCCTQCMYFSAAAARGARARMRWERAHARTPDPYDFLIRNYTGASRTPIFGTQEAAVQHVGAVSTGLAGVPRLHTSARFVSSFAHGARKLAPV